MDLVVDHRGEEIHQRHISKMNRSGQLDEESKGLHPGAIFVGDTVDSTLFNHEKEREKSTRPQTPSVLFVPARDKKQALANAKFLSECCMSGVPPSAATSAAIDAHERFQKWWVKQCFSPDGLDSIREAKRRRLDTNDENQTEIDQKKSINGRDSLLLPDYVKATKTTLLTELEQTGGDTTSTTFLSCVKTLSEWYASTAADAKAADSSTLKSLTLNGSWKSLNRPAFTECLGRNDDGKCMYRLGRIAFDVFRPTDLVCSIEEVINTIQPAQDIEKETGRHRPIPHRLLRDVDAKEVFLYDTTSYIQIEAGQTRRGTSSACNGEYIVRIPIKARLTNHGFLVPDPETKNRYTVHFSGGSLRPCDAKDLSRWREIFDPLLAPPYKVKELAHMLASNIYLGAATQAMQKDGSLRYCLKRPIGGRGQTFIDILYNDGDFRLVQGHHGSYFCFRRMSVGYDDVIITE